MKTKPEIEAMLAEVEKDERLHYAPAQVGINAPLALVQVELMTRARTLRDILDLPIVAYGPEKKRRKG